jgi:hypothetical protein
LAVDSQKSGQAPALVQGWPLVVLEDFLFRLF